MFGLLGAASHSAFLRTGKAVGEAWFAERRSALLLVPSIPARVERNVIINPLHPDTARITHELPEPVWWDDRLYG